MTYTMVSMNNLNSREVDTENPLNTNEDITAPMVTSKFCTPLINFTACCVSNIVYVIVSPKYRINAVLAAIINALITLLFMVQGIRCFKNRKLKRLFFITILVLICCTTIVNLKSSLQPFSVDANATQVHTIQNQTKQFQGVENSTATESSKTNESTFIGEASYAGDGENVMSNNSSEIIKVMPGIGKNTSTTMNLATVKPQMKQFQGAPEFSKILEHSKTDESSATKKVVDDGDQKNNKSNTSFDIEEEKTTKTETVTLADLLIPPLKTTKKTKTNHSIETVEKTPSSTNSPTSPSSLNGMDKSQNGSAGAKDYNNGDKKDTMTKDKTFNSKDDITIPNDK